MGNRDSSMWSATLTSPIPAAEIFTDVRFPERLPVDSAAPIRAPEGRILAFTVDGTSVPKSIEVRLDVDREARVAAAARLSERLRER